MNKEDFFGHKNSKEEAPESSKKGTIKLAVLLLGIVSLGLVLAQVGLSAKVASQTGQTEQKQLVKSKLITEIGQLKMELDKVSDLASLEQRAKTLGFVDGSGSLFYINRFDSLAKAF